MYVCYSHRTGFETTILPDIISKSKTMEYFSKLTKVNVDKHKGRCCLPSLNEKVYEVQVAPKKGFNFATALANVFPLLDIVFSFLDLNEDLRNAAQVCESWRVVAHRILRKRRNAKHVMTALSYEKCLYYSKELKYGDLQFYIVFYAPFLPDKICCHRKGETVELRFSEYKNTEMFPIKSYPKNCFIVRSDLVGVLPSLKSNFYYCGVGFPEIPGIRIESSFCSLNSPEKVFSEHENEQVKCFLAFAQKRSAQKIKRFLTMNLGKRAINRVAFAGGLVTHPIIPQYPIKGDILGIAFLHNDGSETIFDTYSTFIPEDADVLWMFKKLREKPLRTNSFALLVICCAIMESQDILKAFYECFENVPAVAIRSAGELGWDSNSFNETVVLDDKDLLTVYPVIHSYCISVVLLTWDTEEDLRNGETYKKARV